ncbi:hypothetical protein Trydic_g22369 [Trypoxylus dichotomus]
MAKVLPFVFFVVIAYCLKSRLSTNVTGENVFGQIIRFTKNNITQPVVNKFFLNNDKNGTVSKFPPVIEFLAQKVQTQFSNFVYEDLSRPPAWNSPIYTLAPNDPLFEEVNGNSTYVMNLNVSTVDNDRPVASEEDADEEETMPSVLLFEIIDPNKTIIEQSILGNEPLLEKIDKDIEELGSEEDTSTSAELLFEIIKENENLTTEVNQVQEVDSSTLVFGRNGSINYSNNFANGNIKYETTIILGRNIPDNGA